MSEQPLPDWLKTLKSSEFDTAPASDLGDKVVPAPEAPAPEIPIIDYQPNAPDWLKGAPAPEPPVASELVLENSVPVVPSEAVAPVVEEKQAEKDLPKIKIISVEPISPTESSKEKGKSFLGELKQAHEISVQVVACAERPWPESVEAIRGRKEVAAASLSSLQETMKGIGIAPGNETQIRAQREKSEQRYLEAQKLIDSLNVNGLENRVTSTMAEAQRLESESRLAARKASAESTKVGQEVKAWTKAEASARANGLSKEGLTVFQAQRSSAEARLNEAKARSAALAAEAATKRAEAERARIEFEAAQANIQRLNAEKEQARWAAENWQKRLVDPQRQLSEMRNQAIQLGQEVVGFDNILRTENIYTEVAQVADSFGQLTPGFVHQEGLEVDLLQAMREGFTGTQVERDYIFTLAEQPEYANMSIPQLQEMLRDRVGKINRILELEAAGAPEDRVRKLLTDPRYPKFPDSFKKAVGATLNRRSFLPELPEGSDAVLARANRAQRKVYTDVMLALGLQPQTPEASETQTASLIQREQSGELAIQMAEIYAGETLPDDLRSSGAEYGTDTWEIWKENVMKWSRDRVHQQQLDNYADPKLAAAQAAAEEMKADLSSQVEAQTRRATTAETQVASTTNILRQTEQRVEEMAPLAEETKLAREAESAKAEALENAKAEMDQALEQRAKFPGDTAHQAQVATLDKSLSAAAEKMGEAGAGEDAQEALLKVINDQVGVELDAKGEKSATETVKILFDAIKSNEDVKTVAAKLRKVGMGLMGKALEAGINPAQERALLAGFLDVVNNYLNADKTKLSEKETRHSLGRVAEAANVLSEAGFSGFGLIDPVVKLMIESMFSSK